ncbi:MAG: metalloregulator ArsR/SmtB family transcription factor [Elusimicrobia bacterium]|nr:metalloregulator ArsR/SmtB family transcription factor [Elusimicrobiota bacterium]
MAITQIARLLDVVSEPSRLRILLALSIRRMCVCELCAALDLKQTAMSQHLRVLRNCGLVAHRKNGLWVDYELPEGLLSGPSGRVLKTILAEAQKDESIQKDRKAAAKVDRRELCGDAPKRRIRAPHA